MQRYPITGLDRPLALQKNEAPRIPRQYAYESGRLVSPTFRPPLPLKISQYSIIFNTFNC